MRSFLSEVVGEAPADGLSGDHDVSAIIAHQGLDGKGHRITVERSVHLAELVQREQGTCQADKRRQQWRAEPLTTAIYRTFGGCQAASRGSSSMLPQR